MSFKLIQKLANSFEKSNDYKSMNNNKLLSLQEELRNDLEFIIQYGLYELAYKNLNVNVEDELTPELDSLLENEAKKLEEQQLKDGDVPHIPSDKIDEFKIITEKLDGVVTELLNRGLIKPKINKETMSKYTDRIEKLARVFDAKLRKKCTGSCS